MISPREQAARAGKWQVSHAGPAARAAHASHIWKMLSQLFRKCAEWAHDCDMQQGGRAESPGPVKMPQDRKEMRQWKNSALTETGSGHGRLLSWDPVGLGL